MRNYGFGYRADLRDNRDHIYVNTGAKVPGAVDLESHLPPCWDQGQLGSCTAFALTGMVAFFHGFVGSQLWLYYKERALEHSIKSDAGAEIRDGMKVLANQGLPPLAKWKYDVAKFAKAPPASANTAAKKELISDYNRLNGVADMLDVLANGKPFVFGIDVYDSFESDAAANTGVIPIPKSNESLLGGHAILGVGVDMKHKLLKFRNSWSPSWGRNGYGFLPLAYPGLGGPDTDAWMSNAAPL